jgi:HK97 family phage prohead protease
MKFLSCETEFKADDAGEFSGYASVYGNVDRGGDVVQAGAFKEFEANADGRVVMLWQHRSDQPIGTARVKSDKHGLAFEGRLVLEDPRSQVALAHMKARSVRGMSFGYDVLPGGAEITKGGVRKLTALKLWEISLVTFPMNVAAGVSAVKTIREFEEFLRDAGFSKTQAVTIAAGGFRTMSGRRDAAPSLAEVMRNEFNAF